MINNELQKILCGKVTFCIEIIDNYLTQVSDLEYFDEK